jgi:hypothetical protein
MVISLFAHTRDDWNIISEFWCKRRTNSSVLFLPYTTVSKNRTLYTTWFRPSLSQPVPKLNQAPEHRNRWSPASRRRETRHRRRYATARTASAATRRWISIRWIRSNLTKVTRNRTGQTLGNFANRPSIFRNQPAVHASSKVFAKQSFFLLF